MSPLGPHPSHHNAIIGITAVSPSVLVKLTGVVALGINRNALLNPLVEANVLWYRIRQRSALRHEL